MPGPEERERTWFLEYLLAAVLKCGTADLDFLFKFCKSAERVEVDLDLNDIVRRAASQSDGTIDFNILLYHMMLEVFNNLVEELPEELQEVAREYFYPYLNYLDSHFDNDLDNVFFNEDVTREKAVEALENWVKSLA